MQGVILQLTRFGFLILLWGFLLSLVRILRSDLGTSDHSAPLVSPMTSTRTRGIRPRRQQKTARHLVIVSGDKLSGTRITLGNQPILIGRADDCTLVLSDDYISNHHARLIPRDSQWYLEDLGATNGTFVERVRITSPTRVPLGAQIQLGETVLELKS